MLDALHAFSSAEVFLAASNQGDLDNGHPLTRRALRKSKEKHLENLQRAIQVLKQDIAVSDRSILKLV